MRKTRFAYFLHFRGSHQVLTQAWTLTLARENKKAPSPKGRSIKIRVTTLIYRQLTLSALKGTLFRGYPGTITCTASVAAY